MADDEPPASVPLGRLIQKALQNKWRANQPSKRATLGPEILRDGQVKRILVYAGCFNPPHMGHHALLQYVWDTCRVDLNLVAAFVKMEPLSTLIGKSNRRLEQSTDKVDEGARSISASSWYQAQQQTEIKQAKPELDNNLADDDIAKHYAAICDRTMVGSVVRKGHVLFTHAQRELLWQGPGVPGQTQDALDEPFAAHPWRYIIPDTVEPQDFLHSVRTAFDRQSLDLQYVTLIGPDHVQLTTDYFHKSSKYESEWHYCHYTSPCTPRFAITSDIARNIDHMRSYYRGKTEAAPLNPMEDYGAWSCVSINATGKSKQHWTQMTSHIAGDFRKEISIGQPYICVDFLENGTTKPPLNEKITPAAESQDVGEVTEENLETKLTVNKDILDTEPDKHAILDLPEKHESSVLSQGNDSASTKIVGQELGSSTANGATNGLEIEKHNDVKSTGNCKSSVGGQENETASNHAVVNKQNSAESPNQNELFPADQGKAVESSTEKEIIPANKVVVAKATDAENQLEALVGNGIAEKSTEPHVEDKDNNVFGEAVPSDEPMGTPADVDQSVCVWLSRFGGNSCKILTYLPRPGTEIYDVQDWTKWASREVVYSRVAMTINGVSVEKVQQDMSSTKIRKLIKEHQLDRATLSKELQGLVLHPDLLAFMVWWSQNPKTALAPVVEQKENTTATANEQEAKAETVDQNSQELEAVDQNSQESAGVELEKMEVNEVKAETADNKSAGGEQKQMSIDEVKAETADQTPQASTDVQQEADNGSGAEQEKMAIDESNSGDAKTDEVKACEHKKVVETETGANEQQKYPEAESNIGEVRMAVETETKTTEQEKAASGKDESEPDAKIFEQHKGTATTSKQQEGAATESNDQHQEVAKAGEEISEQQATAAAGEAKPSKLEKDTVTSQNQPGGSTEAGKSTNAESTESEKDGMEIKANGALQTGDIRGDALDEALAHLRLPTLETASVTPQKRKAKVLLLAAA